MRWYTGWAITVLGTITPRAMRKRRRYWAEVAGGRNNGRSSNGRSHWRWDRRTNNALTNPINSTNWRKNVSGIPKWRYSLPSACLPLLLVALRFKVNVKRPGHMSEQRWWRMVPYITLSRTITRRWRSERRNLGWMLEVLCVEWDLPEEKFCICWTGCHTGPVSLSSCWPMSSFKCGFNALHLADGGLTRDEDGRTSVVVFVES